MAILLLIGFNLVAGLWPSRPRPPLPDPRTLPTEAPVAMLANPKQVGSTVGRKCAACTLLCQGGWMGVQGSCASNECRPGRAVCTGLQAQAVLPPKA